MLKEAVSKCSCCVSAAVPCCCSSFEILIPDSVSAYERSVLDATWYITCLHYQQSLVDLNRVFLKDFLKETGSLCHFASLDFEIPTKVLFAKVLYSLIARNSDVVCVPQNSSPNNCTGSKVKLRYLCCKLLGVSLERVIQVIKSMIFKML